MTAISGILGLGLAGYSLYLARSYRSSIPSLDDYIRQENGEWFIEERLGKMLDLLGSRFALSMRQSMFQSMGVDAKLQKGVDKAIGMDMLNGSGIGGLLDLIGMSNTKSMLAKNPKTLGLILQRVAPMLNQFLNAQGKSEGGNLP